MIGFLQSSLLDLCDCICTCQHVHHCFEGCKQGIIQEFNLGVGSHVNFFCNANFAAGGFRSRE